MPKRKKITTWRPTSSRKGFMSQRRHDGFVAKGQHCPPPPLPLSPYLSHMSHSALASCTPNVVDLVNMQPLAQLEHPQAQGGVGAFDEALRQGRRSSVLGVDARERVRRIFHLFIVYANANSKEAFTYNQVKERKPHANRQLSCGKIKINKKKQQRWREDARKTCTRGAKRPATDSYLMPTHTHKRGSRACQATTNGAAPSAKPVYSTASTSQTQGTRASGTSPANDHQPRLDTVNRATTTRSSAVPSYGTRQKLSCKTKWRRPVPPC